MISKLALALVVVLCACGGDDDEGGAVGSFDSYVSAFGRSVDAACACAPDPVACAAESDLTSAQISCMRSLVSANAVAVEPTIKCFASATDDFADCLEAAGCQDTTAQQACSDSFDTASDACPELDAAIDEMFSACFDEE